jgi:hypothetical protein
MSGEASVGVGVGVGVGIGVGVGVGAGVAPLEAGKIVLSLITAPGALKR